MFKSPEELEAKAEEYFRVCDARQFPTQVEDKVNGGIIEMSINKPAPYGLVALNAYLGFEDRHGLAEYGKSYPEFSATCKKLRLRVEAWNESNLIEAKNPVGSIFTLKCNHGWQDKIEVNQSITGEQKIIVIEQPWKTSKEKPTADE